MNVEVKLDVTASEFWKIIMDSVKQDMGKDVEISKGITFEKQLPTTLSGVATAKVEIKEYIENKCYSVDFVTARSTVHSTYDIEEESDGIKVSYSEEETFGAKMDQWNAKIVKSFYKKSRTKKLERKLKSIEQHIKGER